MTTKAWISRGVAAVGLAVGLGLAGCGGGDDAPAPVAPDPTAQVPTTASESPSGMVGYLNALGAADAEAKEPVTLEAYDPKTSDDTEPLPLS